MTLQLSSFHSEADFQSLLNNIELQKIKDFATCIWSDFQKEIQKNTKIPKFAKDKIKYLQLDLKLNELKKNDFILKQSDIFFDSPTESIEEIVETHPYSNTNRFNFLEGLSGEEKNNIITTLFPEIIKIKNNILKKNNIICQDRLKPEYNFPTNYVGDNILNLILLPNGIIYRYFPKNKSKDFLKSSSIYINPDHIFCSSYSTEIKTSENLYSYNYYSYDQYNIFENNQKINAYIELAKKIKENERRYFYFSEKLKNEMNIHNSHFNIDLQILRENIPHLYNDITQERTRTNLHMFSLYIQKYGNRAILMTGPFIDMFVALDRTNFNHKNLYGYKPIALISL